MEVKGVKGLKSVGLGGVDVGQSLGERCWRVLGFWWIRAEQDLLHGLKIWGAGN